MNIKTNNKISKYLPEQYNLNIFMIYKNKDKLSNYKKLFTKYNVLIFKYVYSSGGKNILILKI